MNFFSQLFTELQSDNSFFILTWLIGSFLIGLLTMYFWIRRRIRTLQAANEKIALELKQTIKTRETLQGQYDLKEADYKKATLALADKNKALNTLETDKRQLNSRLKSTLDEYGKAKVEHTQTATRLEELNDQILGLRTKNSQLNAEIQQSTQKINQYASTQTSLKDQGELEATIARLQAANKALQTENASLQTATNDSNASIESYEALELKVAKLEADKDQLNEALAEITQLEEGNETLSSTVNKLIGENEDLKEKLEQLPQFEEGNAALNASMLKLIEQNDTLKAQVADLVQYESGNEILNATIVKLMAENEALKGQTAAANSAPLPVVTSVPSPASTTSVVSVDEMDTEQAKVEILAAIGNRIKSATVAEKDDLRKINGIGPFIEEKLNDLGIYTFEQVSQLDDSLIPTLTAAIEFFPGRIDRDEWVGQADRLSFMKSSAAPRRVLKSTTVVTRPSEESFLVEKKAITEKIIVEEATPDRVQRVIRREPIRRVERIVREPQTRKSTDPSMNKPAEVRSVTRKPMSKAAVTPPAPKQVEPPVVKEEPKISKAAPTPSPLASRPMPSLKESLTEKIIVPPPVVEGGTIAIAVKEEMARKEAEAKKAEQARKQEVARKVEQARKEEMARREEEARKIKQAKEEEAKKAEQARKEELAKKEEEARKIKQAKEEEAKKAEEARKEELAKKEEEARKIEEARKAEAKKAEEARKEELAKKEEEARKIEEARKEEAKKAEEARKEELAKQEEAARKAAAARTLVPDDLKLIEGIGPKIHNLLTNVGIITFKQLANKSVHELQDILDDAGPRYRIARPSTWPRQAQMAAAGDMNGLKNFQNRLRGGNLLED